MTHCPIEESSTSVNIAKIVTDVIHENESSEQIKALGTDGTVTNTGRKGGANVLIERHFSKNLHWLVCLMHFNELPLR